MSSPYDAMCQGVDATDSFNRARPSKTTDAPTGPTICRLTGGVNIC